MKTIADSPKKRQGQDNQRKGSLFESKVAEIYGLLNYGVQHGRTFSGRQVDIFLTGKFGDLQVVRAIECKAGPASTEDVDKFLIKLRLVRREFPAALGTLVSGVSFTDATSTHAAHEGIQLITFKDLSAQLIDGFRYASKLAEECEANSRYDLSLHIEPSVGYDYSGDEQGASEVLEDWLSDDSWNQMTLLGDVGTGKTFLTRVFAHRLANKFLQSPHEEPLPVLVDLRRVDREFSLEGLVLTHFARNGLGQVSFDVFMHALGQGNIVLILDGFDEMSAKASPSVTRQNFQELARCVESRSKVLLTCRTHYFKDKADESDVVLGGQPDYEVEAAKDLYWELVSRKGFRIAYLRPFTVSQVEAYVRLVEPKNASAVLKRIRATYNLMELSQRPLLLEMIVKSIRRLKGDQISISTLYRIFTDTWIHRDRWRDALSPDVKLAFVKSLALSLWEQGATTIHYKKLTSYIEAMLAKEIANPQRLVELDSEIRTASFLTRDEDGHYGFAHKSYAEFFVARHLAEKIQEGDVDCLGSQRLTPEIAKFLVHLLPRKDLVSVCESVLTGSFRAQISENAMLCFYQAHRERDSIDEEEAVAISIPFPSGIQLSGARLTQVVLEGAVLEDANLSGADLSESVLRGAELAGADLSGCNLEKSDLAGARLVLANLERANLHSANLEGTDLSRAVLRMANLTDSVLLGTNLKGVDLEGATAKGAIASEHDIELLAEAKSSSAVEEFLEGSKETSVRSTRYEEVLRVSSLLDSVLRPAAFRAAIESTVDMDDILSELVSEVLFRHRLQPILADGEGKFRAFCHSEARRIASTIRRRAIRERASSDLFEDEHFTSSVGYWDSGLESAAIARDAFQKLTTLVPADSLRLLALRYMWDLTVPEIARQEGTSVQQIFRRLHQAKRIAQRELLHVNNGLNVLPWQV